MYGVFNLVINLLCAKSTVPHWIILNSWDNIYNSHPGIIREVLLTRIHTNLFVNTRCSNFIGLHFHWIFLNQFLLKKCSISNIWIQNQWSMARKYKLINTLKKHSFILFSRSVDFLHKNGTALSLSVLHLNFFVGSKMTVLSDPIGLPRFFILPGSTSLLRSNYNITMQVNTQLDKNLLVKCLCCII